MRYAYTILILLAGLLVLAVCSPVVLAGDACSVKQAKRDVRAAKREYVRAASKYREAKRILAATERYSKLYRADVGRWVRLARQCGWGWGEMDWLMRQMEQESKGQPKPMGSRDGVLQIISYWYSDTVQPNVGAAYWRKHRLSFPWDATSVRQSFLHAKVMDKSNWWIVQ